MKREKWMLSLEILFLAVNMCVFICWNGLPVRAVAYFYDMIGSLQPEKFRLVLRINSVIGTLVEFIIY